MRYGGAKTRRPDFDEVAMDIFLFACGPVAADPEPLRAKLGIRGSDLEGARAAAITRLSAEAIAEGRVIPEETRFTGSVEKIEAEIARGGSSSWAELGALRFLRICDEV